MYFEYPSHGRRDIIPRNGPKGNCGVESPAKSLMLSLKHLEHLLHERLETVFDWGLKSEPWVVLSAGSLVRVRRRLECCPCEVWAARIFIAGATRYLLRHLKWKSVGSGIDWLCRAHCLLFMRIASLDTQQGQTDTLLRSYYVQIGINFAELKRDQHFKLL